LCHAIITDKSCARNPWHYDHQEQGAVPSANVIRIHCE